MRLRVLFSQKLGGISWHVGQLFFSSSILRYIFKYEFCQIYLGLFFQDSHRTCVSLSAFSHFLPHYFYVSVSFCVCGCSDFSHGTFSVLLVLICHPPPLERSPFLRDVCPFLIWVLESLTCAVLKEIFGVYVCRVCLCVCAPCASSALGSQKRMLGPLGLVWHTVWAVMWVLEIGLGSSARAVSDLHCGAIALSPCTVF